MSVGNKEFISIEKQRDRNMPIIIPISFLDCIFVNQKDNLDFLYSLNELTEFYNVQENGDISNTIALIYSTPEKQYYSSNACLYDKNFNIFADYGFIYPYKAAGEINNPISAALYKNKPLKLRNFKRNIYFPFVTNPNYCEINKRYPVCVKFNNFNIWIITLRNDNHAYNAVGVITYWLSELAEYLNYCKGFTLYLYLYSSEKEGISISKINDSSLKIEMHKNYLESYINSDNDNSREKALCICILEEISKINKSIQIEKVKALINGKTQKLEFALDAKNNFNIFSLNQINLIKESDVIYGIVLDEIGQFVTRELKIKEGNVDEPKDVLMKIVSFLFDSFTLEANQYEWQSALRLTYSYSAECTARERTGPLIIPKILDCFPEEESKLISEYNETNNIGNSFKYIAEYFAVVQPNGSRKLNRCNIQYLLAYIRAIIFYAIKLDYITYVNGSYRVYKEKSNRIIIEEEFTANLQDKITKNMNYMVKDPRRSAINLYPAELIEEIKQGCVSFYKFSFDDLSYFASSLVTIGFNQKEKLKTCTISDLKEFWKVYPNYAVDDNAIENILKKISQKRRDTYLDPSIPKRDLEPWKYGRSESLNRKPIVQINDVLYWDNSILDSAILLLENDLFNGKDYIYSIKGSPLYNKVGDINKIKGEIFNKYVFNVLKQKLPELDLYYQVKSFNNVALKDKDNNALGDIDILAIDKEKGRIYLIEIKKYPLVKDIKGLVDEYKSMFISSKKRKCYFEKEMQRWKWCKNNLNNIIKEYDLPKGKWKVLYTFLSELDLISKYFAKDKINHTTLFDINIDYLNKLK